MTIITPGPPPLPSGPPPPPLRAPPMRPPNTAQIVFNGNGEEYVWLSIRGALLQIATFGFYRFWYATDVRRLLWTGTSLSGESFEYTGRGRELLIGFLFALAIIVPINLAYFGAGLAAEQIQVFASFPLVLFYMVFGQFALYRARRYRLTRTIWRGVRFWMTGSGWNYAFRWLGWALVAALTLGLAYPWMRASLERYKLRNTFYGDLQGRFDGKGGAFFKRGFWIWLYCMSVVALIGLGSAAQGIEKAKDYKAAGGAAIGFGILAALAIPFLWPYFRALEWRWWASGVRFGALSLESKLTGGTFLKLYVKSVLAAMGVSFGMSAVIGMIVSVFAAIFIGTGAVSFDAKSIENLATGFSFWHGLALLGGLIGYLVFLMAVGIATRYFLTFCMWGALASAVTVYRLDALEGVIAHGDAANALGEGLADSLDVAGF